MDDATLYFWPWDGRPLLSVGAVLVYASWLVGRRREPVRSVLADNPWIDLVAGFTIAPAAVAAAGYLIVLALALTGAERFTDDARIVAALGVALMLSLAVARLLEVRIASGALDSRITALPRLPRNILYGLSLFLGLLIFLSVNGYSPTELYISTGAAAALVAFAMQQTLGDLFSGIALSIERPFWLGDWIVLPDGTEGQVVDINWRATRLRGWDNATIVLPNSVLARQGFKNLHGSRDVYAPWYFVKVPGDIDPRFAKSLLLEAALRCKHTLAEPLPVIRLTDASTLPYTYMVWVHFPNYPAMFAGREELYREIHYALERAGLKAAPEIQEIRHRRTTSAELVEPTAALALKSLDLARALSEEDLDRIALMSQRVFVDAGTIVLDEGVPADAFDIIVNGVVEASVKLPDGTTRRVERLVPGSCFGITSMLAAEPSMLQFKAATDVTLVRVDITCLRSVLAGRDEIAEDLARLVQARREQAEKARATAQQPTHRLSLQALVRRIERSFTRAA